MSTASASAIKRSASSIDDIAPIGYHYYGEKPSLLPDGNVTTLIRRDSIAGTSRKIKYQDLYCEIIKGEKVFYACCVYECDRGSDNPIPVYLDKGTVQFQNFFDHLTRFHPEYLEKSDRPIAKKKVKSSVTIKSFYNQQNVALTGNNAGVINNNINNNNNSGYVKKKLTDKWITLLDSVAEVVSHGGYPLSFVSNSATKDFLVRLNVVKSDFQFPHRTTHKTC
jgi:hypothetical protein